MGQGVGLWGMRWFACPGKLACVEASGMGLLAVKECFIILIVPSAAHLQRYSAPPFLALLPPSPLLPPSSPPSPYRSPSSSDSSPSSSPPPPSQTSSAPPAYPSPPVPARQSIPRLGNVRTGTICDFGAVCGIIRLDGGVSGRRREEAGRYLPGGK